jgi:4-hydroxy-tetrahydrodipicolinate synthase
VHIVGRQVSRLSGYAPAVPTPFYERGAVDLGALEGFCDRQVREDATALVVCGTTGEAATLTRSEQQEIVRVAVRVARGRVPVVAGAGSNSTSQTVELAADAERVSADAILSVVPYYNKPISRTACSPIFARSPIRSAFRSFSTTFRRAQCAVSPTPPSRAWLKGPGSSR